MFLHLVKPLTLQASACSIPFGSTVVLAADVTPDDDPEPKPDVFVVLAVVCAVVLVGGTPDGAVDGATVGLAIEPPAGAAVWLTMVGVAVGSLVLVPVVNASESC